MNELVVHHTYAKGLTFDISGYCNHGLPTAVAPGTGDFVGTFGFGSAASRIVVPRSSSLAELRSVRVRMRFYPTFIGSGERTLAINLLVADQAFSISMPAMSGMVACSIAGASLSAAVNVNEWNELELTHDGISEARLSLNGQVTVARDAAGAVPGVGPAGLVIGHSTDMTTYDPDDPTWDSAFRGYIAEFSLHKYDPRNDAERLLDLCCLDRATVDDLLDRARKNGWDADRLGRKVRDVLDLGAEAAAAARGEDAERAEAHRRFSRDALLALDAPNPGALYDVLDRFHASIRDVLTDSELEAFGQRAAQQLADWPFTLLDLVEIAPALCMDRFLPPGFGRPEPEDEKRERPADEVEWPEGDPDTDRPGDEPPDDWVQGGEEPPGTQDDRDRDKDERRQTAGDQGEAAD